MAPFASKAQHTTEHTNVLWAGYSNIIHFNKKWSLVNDAQVRTKDWTKKWLLYDVRSGLNYSFNDRVSVAGGFALFRNAQYIEKQFFFKNEWRPWQELSWQLKFHKIILLQRLRTEQRFLQQVVNNNKTGDYKYIFRSRYRFEWQFPLKEKAIVLSIGNEVFINPGYLSNSLFFDQNRTFCGINFKLNKTTTLQSHFLKVYQWRSSISVLEDQNIFRVNINQQLSGRKNHGSKS
ncbi:MAG: DUF2490 domain-containing protein [Dyadobacter sp.]